MGSLTIGMPILPAGMEVVGVVVVARTIDGTSCKVNDRTGPEKQYVGNQSGSPYFPGWLTGCWYGTLAGGYSSAKNCCTTGKCCSNYQQQHSMGYFFLHFSYF